jgi:hypothetical protein
VPLVGQVYGTERATLIQGDCLEVMQSLPDALVDAVITDPPYPCIKRSYGMWTEEQWWDMMRALIPEVRRVLKPTGSAIFVLQPSSKKVGSMRSWLWEFMVWICRDWNMIQDVWWWNDGAVPGGGEGNRRGLLRPSVKACVWAGAMDCYRDRAAVAIDAAKSTMRMNTAKHRYLHKTAGCHGIRRGVVGERCQQTGKATPFNLLPFANGSRYGGAIAGHPAGTSPHLCSWWTRYICPPVGTILDPFSGSGTVGTAALKEGRRYIGIETVPAYCSVAKERIAKAELACVEQKET